MYELYCSWSLVRDRADNGKLGRARFQTHAGDKVVVKLDTGMENEATGNNTEAVSSVEGNKTTLVTAQPVITLLDFSCLPTNGYHTRDKPCYYDHCVMFFCEFKLFL